jgi:hypothetical protein
LQPVSKEQFFQNFSSTPHAFLSRGFLELQEHKVDELLFLSTPDEKNTLGFVFGKNNSSLRLPFSAPFGGVFFKSPQVYAHEVDAAVQALKTYLIAQGLSMQLSLAPAIYEPNINAKLVSAFLRHGFHFQQPALTSQLNLKAFPHQFPSKSARKFLRQAQENKLVFKKEDTLAGKAIAYQTTANNRLRLGRPVNMTLADFQATEKLFPIDYFTIQTAEAEVVAAAIYYPFSHGIALGAVWGDSAQGRALRAMDFLFYELVQYYKNQDFNYLDLGISTNAGEPDSGLLRFKETHGAETDLRFSISF